MTFTATAPGNGLLSGQGCFASPARRASVTQAQSATGAGRACHLGAAVRPEVRTLRSRLGSGLIDGDAPRPPNTSSTNDDLRMPGAGLRDQAVRAAPPPARAHDRAHGQTHCARARGTRPSACDRRRAHSAPLQARRSSRQWLPPCLPIDIRVACCQERRCSHSRSVVRDPSVALIGSCALRGVDDGPCAAEQSKAQGLSR